MSNMLVFAIAVKDEETVLKLLKAIPLDILFYKESQRDFWITMLKEYKCQRGLDYLRNVAPEAVKSAKIFPLSIPKLTLEPGSDHYSKLWNEILNASKAQSAHQVFIDKLIEFESLLAKNEAIQSIHFLRAAHVGFFTEKYNSATLMLEKCVTQMRNNAVVPMAPASLVDEALSELVFRLFGPFKVTLSDKYKDLFKNNLYYTQQVFSVCHEVFLFPLSETITLDTLQAASKAMDEFNSFKRTLPYMKMEHDVEYQKIIKKRLFTMQLFSNWLTKIERQHSLGVLFTDLQSIESAILKMPTERLVKVLKFHHIKIQVLHFFVNAYKMLEQNENPYLKSFEQTQLIYSMLCGRNNNIFLESMVEPTKKDENSIKNKKTKRKNKHNNKKKDNKVDKPSLQEKSLEDYKELPTYYPESLTNPRVTISNHTQVHLLMFATKQRAKLPLSPESKMPLIEPKDSLDRLNQQDETLPASLINYAKFRFSLEASKLITCLGGEFFVISDNRLLEISAPHSKKGCFIQHPERFVEALYLAYKNHIAFSPKVLVALNYAQPQIDSYLYQVDASILRPLYDMFIRDFGKVTAMHIFIRHGVFGVLFHRFNNSETEKNVATPQFHS